MDQSGAAVANLPTPIQAVVEQKIEALLRQSVEQTLGAAVVCSYLDEQAGACQIYDARPLACRTYGFFVARDQDQDCKQIEVEVNDRGDAAIIWGYAEALRHNIARLSGNPIASSPDDMAAEEHQCITQAPGGDRVAPLQPGATLQVRRRAG
jgi:Fe-S-cluster containining protein